MLMVFNNLKIINSKINNFRIMSLPASKIIKTMSPLFLLISKFKKNITFGFSN